METNDKNNKRSILVDILDGLSFSDTGQKSGLEVCCSSEKESSRVYYPSIYLSSKQLPSLTNYEVDDDIMMVVKGKIVSHSLNENTKNSEENYSIDIKEISCIKK
jgi:hypothetical protein